MPIFKISQFFSVFLSVRLFSVLRGHSFFSSTPQRPMTSDFEGFSVSINCRYQNVRKTLTYLWKRLILNLNLRKTRLQKHQCSCVWNVDEMNMNSICKRLIPKYLNNIIWTLVILWFSTKTCFRMFQLKLAIAKVRWMPWYLKFVLTYFEN